MNTHSRSFPSSLFPFPSNQGFTLIELLIVIAIICILAGVLLSSFGGATESAKIAQCQSNLRNLAAAVNAQAMASGHYPYAESAQYLSTAITEDGEVLVGVHKGWLSWLDDGKFRGRITEPMSIDQPSYADIEKNVRYALTNGVIWTAIGKNSSTYQCPAHAKAYQKTAGHNPGWSYAMNPFFGYEREKGKALATEGDVVLMHDLARADRRLLFAEIQGLTIANPAKYNATSLPDVNFEGGGSATDGVLQYRNEKGDLVGGQGSSPESMGFNHIRSNRIIGLAAFADGHTEAIVLPKSGDLKQLTGWLCEGFDVTHAGDHYEHIRDTDVE